jgi:hypothetical protein
MPSSSPGEIDWEQLKQEAPASTRVALDHLERLARIQTAQERSPFVPPDAVPPASRVALVLAGIAIVRVLFAIGAAALLPDGPQPAVPLWVMSTAAVVFTSGGIALWVGGERDWRARHLGIAYVALGGAFVSRHLTDIATAGSSTIAMFAIALRALPVEAFLSFFVLAFLEVFPRVTREAPAQRAVTFLKRIAFGTGMSLAILNAIVWIGVLAGDSRAPADRIQPWLPSFSGQNLFWLVTLATLVPTPLLVMGKASHSRGEERHRARLLLAGVVLAVAPFVAVLVVQGLTGWFNSAARVRAGAAVIYPALLTLPLTTAYAVLARGALDIRVLVRNAAHHTLARGVLTIGTIVPLLVTMALAYDYRTRTLESLLAMPFARALLCTAAVALVLTVARTRVLRAIDRVFLRSEVDAETLVADVGQRARRLPTAHDVGADLIVTLDRAFGVEHGAVFVRDRSSEQFEAIGRQLPPLSTNSALVDLASTGEDVLTTEQPTPLAGLLPHDEQAWLASTGVEALIPLHGRGDRLIGLVALGHRRGDWTYTPRERRTLKAVVSAVAPVLERHLDARSGGTGGESAVEDALLVCVDCGVIHAAGARQCPCGGAIEGGVIPRLVSGKYEVTRRLGRGAMGVVYEARDLALERVVAIKALPHLSYREGERLVQEARRMTRVTHPNLAYVIGLETFNTMPLVVMEYLAGRTLRDRIARGPLPLSEVTRIGMALCDALIRLHQSGLLHRDIKPGNVGFDAEGTPKLLDFGLALPVEVTRATTVALAGTPLYLPPEAWQGHPADHHVDLWGLSMTLCEALLGSHPLSGITGEELEAGAAARAADVLRQHPRVDRLAAAVFARALAADPAERFADAVDLRAALVLLHTSTAGRTPGTTEQIA